MQVPKEPEFILKSLHQAGFEAYLAGGCVRDFLRGQNPSDYDIATNAPPDAIQKLFSRTIPVGVQFGVILVVENGKPFEVATFRTEGDYQDGRRPNRVEFTRLEEDAKRRDFTVNGLYFDIQNKKVIDLVEGQKDITKKIIRTIGNPETRFLEDHLRLFRAIRFATQLDYQIEENTLKGILKLADRLARVSYERIREELTRLLCSKNPRKGIELLDQTGLLKQVLPEMETLKGVEQPIEYHPEGDVYIHTLMLLDGLEKAPVELVMGCLLHDIAKPATFERAPDRIRFHGHDRIGAEMARTICKRLTFSNEQTDIICDLVREHLRFKDAFQMKTSTLKRFFSLPRFDLHMELHRRDCLASHKNLDAYYFCQKKLEEFSKEPPPPLRLINGEDLKSMGYPSGPAMGQILRAVEDGILEGQIHNKEEALDFVRKSYPQR